MKKIIIIAVFLSISYLLNAQTELKTITGKVTDNAGEGLPGVSILGKGTTIGTMSAADGTYSISLPENVKILVFSYIGMETQEIEIKGRTLINVVMLPSNEDIEEVVVTSYGRRPMFKNIRNKRNNRSNNENFIYNTEEYSKIKSNEYKDALQNPFSTFSIDVDNASYSNVRRFINNGTLPPKDAVRIEELINYFDYNYPERSNYPFSFITEVAECPWETSHKLVHIGIQGKRLNYNDIKPSNLTFLIDVSGSMSAGNKLPLLKKSFKLLLNELSENDKISIVVYAGAAGLVLPPTSASEKEKIIKALDQLQAGGTTAGGSGIKLAYKTAKKAYIKGGNNRVILATDGDFNVGVSSTGELVRLIEEKRQNDIYLTILGFGSGNYKDGRMEEISNAGNGNYYYIDNFKEAEKVFVKDMRANMFTIAKDVKIQVEFNPAKVKAYRLIGYENRVLENKDFEDDKIDAGELGPGHTVTALYEIIPVTEKDKRKISNKTKYQNTELTDYSVNTNEIMTLRFRYKPPKSDKSILIETPVLDKNVKFENSSDNFKFSATVAAFGMILRDSEFKGKVDYDMVLKIAQKSKGKDKNGYRAEFISLVKKAKNLKRR